MRKTDLQLPMPPQQMPRCSRMRNGDIIRQAGAVRANKLLELNGVFKTATGVLVALVGRKRVQANSFIHILLNADALLKHEAEVVL